MLRSIPRPGRVGRSKTPLVTVGSGPNSSLRSFASGYSDGGAYSISGTLSCTSDRCRFAAIVSPVATQPHGTRPLPSSRARLAS